MVAICWTILFFSAVAIRVALGPLGEFICTNLLILGTTLAFTVSWRGRIGRANRDGRDEEHLEDNEHRQPVVHNSETGGLTIGEAPRTGRLPFLDNIKTFLTFLVVTHHIACAFGGCGEGTWYLIVGEDGPPAFTSFLKSLTLLDQSYFMSLFFFIAAYFVPTSYEKAGGWEGFKAAKRRRILVPALFVTFFVSPVSILIPGETRAYYPNPGVAWFLFWLLLFDLVFVSFVHVGGGPTHEPSASSQDGLFLSVGAGCRTISPEDITLERSKEGLESTIITGALMPDESELPAGCTEETMGTGNRPFPTTCLRMGCGIGICGLAMLPFVILLKGSFASMPVSMGSLLCDFLMFYAGVLAKRNQWLEYPLAEQLDIRPAALVGIVLSEGTALLVMSSVMDKTPAIGLPFMLTAGMFCLDMSLLVLLIFQRWVNFETRLTQFLARGAYAVYLLHPLIVTGTTAVYIRIFDKSGVGDEDGAGKQSSYFYPIGFLFVNVVSHLINWPLAYLLAHMPYLKKVI